MKAGVGLRLLVVAAALAAATGVSATALAGDPGTAMTLFQLTNQDRASNGLGALGYSGSLSSIGTNAHSGGCGGVNGRSQDMVDRNYFAHQIPPCGSYVWQVFNLGAYTAAGENIGWNNYPLNQSVGQINTAFMNSADHRANILGNYNQLGTGAWAATGSWTGGGSPASGVVMYTEIFIKSPGGGGGPPPLPKPPPPPRPRPTRPPSTTPPTSNGAAVPTVAPAPSPSPSIPSCPVPTELGEADRTSPAPTLPSDGGPAPCPAPNLVGAAPSGGPTAIKLTGSIDAGSRQLTVSSASGIVVGDTVAITGAGPDGGDLVARITSISGNVLTLDSAAARSVRHVQVQDLPNAEVGADREVTRRGILETVVDQVLRLFLNV